MAENSLQVVQPQTQLARSETFAPRTLSEAVEFAKLIADSGMVPKDYIGKPGAIVVALQMGMEVGLQPMQALQSIAVINGRPSIWGDGALAIIKAHPDFTGIEEDDPETIKKNNRATCIIKRRNQKDVKVTFGMDDAQTAGLWKKSGPWTTAPFRMMQMRARAFAMRDQFPDALKGIKTVEEVRDYGDGSVIESTSIPQGNGQSEAQAEPTIGKEIATSWYKAYKVSGHTPEESKAFLKETWGIESPKTSQDIPLSDKDKAFTWANTPAPIRVKADSLFESLGFTADEKIKFVNEQKVDWTKIVDELTAEIERRNKEEIGE